MTPEIQALLASTEKIKTVGGSVLNFIGGLKTALDQAVADQSLDQVKAISADLDSEADALSAAITAGTPEAGRK